MNEQTRRYNHLEINLLDSIYKIPLLTKDEIDSIFKLQKPPELKHGVLTNLSLKAYKLTNGEVIVVSENDSEYPLYPSESILLKQLTQFNKNEPEEILVGINYLGEKFPSEAEALSNKFLRDAGVVNLNINSIELIKAADVYINSNRDKKFFKDNFLSMIALIGNLLNRDHETNWVMLKSDNVWNPCLNYNEKNIFFADYILIDFNDMNLKEPLLQSYLSVVDIIEHNL